MATLPCHRHQSQVKVDDVPAQRLCVPSGTRQSGVCATAEASLQEGGLGPACCHQIRVQGNLPAWPASQDVRLSWSPCSRSSAAVWRSLVQWQVVHGTASPNQLPTHLSKTPYQLASGSKTHITKLCTADLHHSGSASHHTRAQLAAQGRVSDVVNRMVNGDVRLLPVQQHDVLS